ncbi:MAG TPA: hypothetical protein VNL91_09830 [Thermoanaerobaculia bacterium]|nr:hypothetical protein [Thermoanaerobaculia bacterium]
MKDRWREGIGAALLAALAAGGCTGGQEGTAAVEEPPRRHLEETAGSLRAADPRAVLESISPSIPVYAGAQFRQDLTSRDALLFRSQYGPETEVYTLATNDSFPQVYHYYTTYLAQYRAYQVPAPLPPEQQKWRTLEVPLEQAMQDPFIPGSSLPPDAKRILLQVAETEAEPKTVIRYIITPTSSARAAGPGPQVSGLESRVPEEPGR